MADAIISAVAERIIALLEEQVRCNVNLVRGAEEEVRSLADELEAVRNVLDDAERRGSKERGVKDWLSRLEQTSYAMEDVLDEWIYALRKLQIDAAARKQVWSLIPSSSCLCCKRVVVRHGLAKNIIKVKGRLDEVLKERDRYSFVNSRPVADLSHESWRDPSTSFADLEVVRGRDSDRDVLVGKLMDRQAELGIQVVSIVGVGGLGKTTLAQLVYNDSRVEKEFPLRIWICVSDPFDLGVIAKGILESVGRGSSSNTTQLDALLKNIEEFISGKRFLLVLDDVWTEDSKRWEPLKASLRCGGEGSKVLVTTRNERVAKIMGTIENDIHRPELLSHGDCWSLMCHISLSGRSEEECRKFQDIGNKIASKCEGLPLAACVLGSLLQFKSSLEEWETILESEIWQLEEAKEQLFPHLLLSYNQLSPVLKRCFSYCAIFPKDFKIDVDELIENWIAQGYLRSDVGSIRDMELKGQECFQNLAMRSLFQDFERRDFDAKIISCKMHDIVQDFAQSLRKDRSGLRMEAGMNMATCHICSFSLVYSVKTYRSLVSYEHPYICDCLRSLRVLCIARHSLHGIRGEMMHLIHLRWLDLSWNKLSWKDVKIICLLYNLQFLRLNNCKLEKIPSDIENLIHLRHLDLSNNNYLEELPEEIGNLIQLRRLNLSDNTSLEEFPESIWGLIHLKHILNRGTGAKLFSQRLSQLTGLCTLSEFWGGRGCGKLGWLKNLNLLSGSLTLHVEMIDDSKDMVEDAREADLRNKVHLRTLTIRLDDWMYEENDLAWKNVIDALEPHPNLQNLDISYYRGSKLEGWITSPLLKLRSIQLRGFNRMRSLPPFGKLPCLEELGIRRMNGLELVGREFLGIGEDIGIQTSSNTTIGFPKLKKLMFWECPNWKEWEDIRVEEEEYSASITLMPCLAELFIENCDSLTALPERLLGKKALSLEYVQIRSVSDSVLIKCYQDREGVTSLPFGGLKIPFGPT